ncbi:LytTR family transcriptional regulator DNA-binding domain-containing protein [Kineosporia rhizophila]|uniref:LytTR family DNA-binding domain-containing protein n=1 Tax=Kineosporia rhizophila TaxID=84633 RepID=UPI001E64DB13|nr:LytTR family DNA-binding domain-containing protein [Kineosporia rhizophila]MCE0540790.1 LytTR family transcriptional regulator DNA-binding domain-containing protein [Kineosporia rhizophila]
MVNLVCSDDVRQRLERELAALGLSLGPEDRWVLVERGHPIPEGVPAIVFDPLDYMDVVRVLAAGVRAGGTFARTLIGQRNDAFVVLTAREVLVVEASADGIFAVTAAGRLRVRATLQQVESDWAALGFVRANRSQLVNLAHVKEIVPWFNSRYVLRIAGGSEVEVSKVYARQLRSTLGL